MIKRDPAALACLVLFVLSLGLPVSTGGGWITTVGAEILWAAPAIGFCLWRLWWTDWSEMDGKLLGLLAMISTLAAALPPLMLLSSKVVIGFDGVGFWAYVFGLGFLVWRSMTLLSALEEPGRLYELMVPAIFGLWAIYLWQVVVSGFAVPQVLLPAPSLIAAAIANSADILWADFQQTFMKAVLAGFLMGCGSGFVVAVLVDRVPFLQRGLLPLGSLVSAIPIVGIAPIMVMWFGFDWQSKAAVIVVMTFFPMLVNTLTGINASGAMEHDLMRSYGASYFQTLFRLRLPNALPFIFNALKINSTLALIGAIVAEFFGTPIVGMGFRISTEVGRMNVDMVWATIAVAAVAGSGFYGALALLERSLTFWHPSYRKN